MPSSEGPDYSRFTKSIHLAFTNEDRRDSTPTVALKVNGNLIQNVGLDTGSTVFVLTQELVPDFPADPKAAGLAQGYVEYATSGVRYDGYWFSVTVTFEGIGGTTASSDLHVLVITHEEGTIAQPVHYMGIRFGLINKNEGYTPNKNPFLTIKQYNNEPISSETFRRGYVIHRRSIEVGLTGDNTKSFKYVKLTNKASPSTQWYWDPLPAALSINGGSWMPGDALIDTGVTTMQVFSPQDDPNKVSSIAIRFPAENTDLPEYSFRWPGELDWMPLKLDYYESTKKNEAFVNTGRNFYYKFDTLLDVEEGYWGLKEI